MDNSTLLKKTDVPFLDDKVYGMKVDNYMVNYKDVREKKIAWVEINENISNFLLQHSTPYLESVLKSNSKWDKIMTDQDIILLLQVIQYITHKKDG